MTLSLALAYSIVATVPSAEAALQTQDRMTYPVSGSVRSDYDGGPCGKFRDHRAYDVPDSLRTAIVASYAGSIRKASSEHNIYGWWIAVTHHTSSSTRYETFYAHLDNTLGSPYPPGIQNGTVTKVIRGQVIGYMGYSGNTDPPGVDGTHLHFAIKKGSPTSSGWNSATSHALAKDFDGQIGCGKTWTVKAPMPMDFSSDLWVRMMWYLRGTQFLPFVCFNYGNSNDFPLGMGNWNGDNSDGPGLVRGNEWHLRNGFDGSANYVFAYGRATDSFIKGDWTGNGIDTPGVVRGNTWYLKYTNIATDTSTLPPFTFGKATDTFVAGDWNGNGVDTPGVVRGNTWYLKADNLSVSQALEVAPFGFGTASDLKVVGDWDGDGKFTPAVVRDNIWYWRNDLKGGVHTHSSAYGSSLDTPTPEVRYHPGRIATQAVARGSMETSNTC